jgi:hypothetical protein
MAIANYTDLKASAANWQARADLTALIPDAITIFEAKANRELGEVLTEQTLTGIVNNRAISIAAYQVAEPIAVFLVTPDAGETMIGQRQDGTYPYSEVPGWPSVWSKSGSTIVFNCPLMEAYSFRFEFRQRFALSDAAPTNWLLDEHPDVYLAGTLVWGGLFTEDDGRAAKFTMVLDEAIPSIKRYIAAQHRAELSLDPALTRLGGNRGFNVLSGQ